MAEHIEDHAKLYKNSGKGEQDTSRRRRTEQTIELRRQKRGNALNKRRNIDPNADYESESTDMEKYVPPKFNCTLPQAKELLLNNPTQDILRKVFEHIRRLLSRDKNPPIDEVVNEGLVVALVQALGYPDEKVQYEAAWALTNVVSGTTRHTQAAVDAGATVALINLARSTSNHALADQCFWAVANIMGDCAIFRDHAIDCNVIPVLREFTDNVQSLKVTLARTLAWVCSNICRHKEPQINHDQMRTVLPAIGNLLTYDDQEVRQDACWALSYLTDNDDAALEIVLSANLLTQVKNLISSNVDKMVAPALRVFGNFVSGNDRITQVIIDTAILRTAMPSIMDKSGVVLKEACWMLSNILAGTVPQIQAVIDAGLVPKIVFALECGEFKVKGEAAYALSNLALSGTQEQVYTLAQAGILSAVAKLLNVRHVEFLINLLTVVHAVFNSISTMKPDVLEAYKDEFEAAGGIDFVEELQNHENQKIYEFCYEIINNYFFQNDDIENDPNMAIESPVFRF